MRYAHAWPWPLATLREWPRFANANSYQLSANGLRAWYLRCQRPRLDRSQLTTKH
ncbi:MAG: hypothetical protein F6K50_35285 [Moorea sp. SIO3I7]|uniref:hypothetical protein n=1 Tax=unclassified Moorena TaxID=2683338 RepID=UPI0013C983A8|nr:MULTISPECIES: hypothetical protein [unclassified Moorena]NEO00520.1 hypothetical protein [Moorena sp. SIO3I7]NEO45218.1 hypothetical protein [Moorena sp. SIO4A3]NEO62236.1 hypothetical protein [Moorena sp. SIO4G2]NEO12442.1 hypothetical protein [Moorena sp. SIO3E8]NEO24090.1 hypothetical protein [Moorena sp. SIO4A5]